MLIFMNTNGWEIILIVRWFIVSVIVLWIRYETENMYVLMLAYAFEAINVGNNMDLV